ncbi:hypothetical protein TU62_04665 [Bacillus cereus]|nr:lanthionine synthetase LanC family protein [Bacillus wiedmannii]KMP77365.1 hypothetical protein TU62_04665 [Bacillus cereus]
MMKGVKPMHKSYLSILENFNLKPNLRYPWASIGYTNQVQGWKLHLSTIETEAMSLLQLVIPFLRDSKVNFKIAQNEKFLGLLNEGAFGSKQVGKFMTIYPHSDSEAKQLAEGLVKITSGFHGPIIPTDLRLGDIVYTRYGGINPIITRDRLGQTFQSIYAPDGTLRIDSYDVPFKSPADIPNPFEEILSRSGTSPLQIESYDSSELLGPGYLVLEVIKADSKGSVFLCLDLRNQDEVCLKIIKQGRPYCVSDQYGRDVRTRLQHQESLHRILSGAVPIPNVDPYFEVNDYGYLPLEYIEGENLKTLILNFYKNGSWDSMNVDKQLQLLTYLRKIIKAINQLHDKGYIHRDLTGSNIWIGKDKQVYLIDLELTHAIDDESPAFCLGTPGFMSPDQNQKKTPTFADDIYALGCVMVLLFTGLDPNHVLFVNKNDLKNRLNELLKSVPDNVTEMITNCLHADSLIRPNLKNIKLILESYISILNSKLQTTNSPISMISYNKSVDQKDLNNIILKGQQGLLHDVVINKDSGLWLSPPYKKDNKISPTSEPFEMFRDANRGIAGVVYLLGRMARYGYKTKEIKERVQKAIQWLLTSDSVECSPGLHFGEAGVAVALVEAISGGLIERNSEINHFLLKALNGKLDWPDVTHGAAGQGISIFYCADLLNDHQLLDFSHRCADFLINSQKDDGSWEMPPGVEGMSGETMTGFAHGVAGMVYFLAEYSRRFKNNEADRAWKAGVNWLVIQSVSGEDGKTLEWKYSDKNEDRWIWWCHGSPGIALMFLRLFEQTGNSLYSQMASKALHVLPSDLYHHNLSQCHGLSGLGEIYLEAFRVLGDKEWFRRAEQIAHTLINLRHETEYGTATWLVEDPNAASADLMVGSGGVIHFLFKFLLNNKKVGFPLLLEPIF